MIAITKNTLKKRNSILDAAIRAFQELGYENASMDYIAELANASKRTVYNHFSGKEPLFKEVIARFLSQIMQLKQIRYSPDRSLEEQLCEFADAKIAIAHNPSWLGVMKVSMGVLVSHPELARETVLQCADIENTLASWLKEAVEDGKLEVEDTELVSKVFDSMIAGAFFWPAAIHGPMDEAEEASLKHECIKTFLARYGS